MVSEYRSKSFTERHKHTMALDQSALLNLLAELKLTDVTDRIRVVTETLYQELIDAEATAFIGAAPFERTGDRTAHRAMPPRLLSTTAGDLNLKIPKLRAGSFFPSLRERLRRVDQVLFAVVRWCPWRSQWRWTGTAWGTVLTLGTPKMKRSRLHTCAHSKLAGWPALCW